jgi:putative membrane protein
MSLLIRILGNAVAILIAAKLVPGFAFLGGYPELLIAGAVIGLLNGLVKPIIQLLSFPAILLTLGLFNIIINIALLLLADRLLENLVIRGFWAAFWGVVIISLTNHFISHFAKKRDLDNNA